MADRTEVRVGHLCLILSEKDDSSTPGTATTPARRRPGVTTLRCLAAADAEAHQALASANLTTGRDRT